MSMPIKDKSKIQIDRQRLFCLEYNVYFGREPKKNVCLLILIPFIYFTYVGLLSLHSIAATALPPPDDLLHQPCLTPRFLLHVSHGLREVGTVSTKPFLEPCGFFKFYCCQGMVVWGSLI
jgi:hypothetical protein